MRVEPLALKQKQAMAMTGMLALASARVIMRPILSTREN